MRGDWSDGIAEAVSDHKSSGKSKRSRKPLSEACLWLWQKSKKTNEHRILEGATGCCRRSARLRSCGSLLPTPKRARSESCAPPDYTLGGTRLKMRPSEFGVTLTFPCRPLTLELWKVMEARPLVPAEHCSVKLAKHPDRKGCF